MVFRDTTTPKSSWVVGVRCTECTHTFEPNGDDLVRFVDPETPGHWARDVVTAYVLCPLCGARTAFPRQVLPKWLWSRVRIEIVKASESS